MTKVIGLCGPIGAGKSLAAKILEKELSELGLDVYRVPFSKSLKEFALRLGWNGEKDEKGRRGLQLLGTDVVRNCFDEDFWVDQWWDKTSTYRNFAGSEKNVIIADDVRFPNEEQCIKELGGKLIQIRLNGQIQYSTLHPSETQNLNPDETIWSDFGEDKLLQAIKNSCFYKEITK